MNLEQLEKVARAMVAEGKGILAADESTPTIKKRFDAIDTGSTVENRRSYREMLFTTPGAEDYISGVILFDETLRQSNFDGVLFPEYLAGRGMIPGIKVDRGAKTLAGFAGEKVTEGLDGLRERLAEYFDLGAQFAKWRAVITIGNDIPSDCCIRANAHALARYAALCQEADIVPIVEPEVLMDGSHTLERCYGVTADVLSQVFAELERHRVALNGIILKPNMVISGTECPARAGIAEVAAATVKCLTENVPVAVPGIAFLSGGQNDVEATEHLNAMNQTGPHPWQLSFSYGRALQAPALKAWHGNADNYGAGQQALFKRARLNGLARSGSYSSELETAAAA